MRRILALIAPAITIILILLLDRSLGPLPPLGRLLDPFSGWAANAEPTSGQPSEEFRLAGLKGPVEIWFEDRMVPHLRAQNFYDLFLAQGYIHAYFRLWQMDFQTRAAAGRVGEVVGEKMVKDPHTGEVKNAMLEFDRLQRRKGMVYGAEQALKAIEAEPKTKEMLDAYTRGVNAFIEQLSYRRYPVEYKLMDYTPEPWSNLKTALLLKAMADDLTGATDDLQLSLLRERLAPSALDSLFPQRLQISTPVIPSGTPFNPPSLALPKPPGDTVWASFVAGDVTGDQSFPDRYDGIGSNNWALSGTRTTSGATILCNDPHLGLNLPSLWFEMQLQAPGMNVYGVSLPGAPGIIIGFNDSLSWGLTNNYRDVKDFYDIEAIDNSFYRLDGKPLQFELKAEEIKIKGKPAFIDTVRYTIHGPVTWDRQFPDPTHSGKLLATTWMAHRESNELLSILLLNQARNYIEFTEAIMHFHCPAQNMIYADRAGNIALWGQGQFINKWKNQGRYVMKGNTSATLWGEDIPVSENPHALNPPQGYLSSANQITTDTTYPYWYNGIFSDFRALRINELLASRPVWSLDDMLRMQQDCISVLARRVAPAIDSVLIAQGKDQLFSDWNYALEANSSTATSFRIFWTLLYYKLWSGHESLTGLYPSTERTLELFLTNPSLHKQAILDCYTAAKDSLRKLAGTEWYKVKATRLTHLSRLDAFSILNLKTGGWGSTINAMKERHGPSWRMVVEMGSDSVRAYGVYPGGQSGNPGSPYYDSFVRKWEQGDYYRLLFLPAAATERPSNITSSWTLHPKS